MSRLKTYLILGVCLLSWQCQWSGSETQALPSGFVYVKDSIPSVLEEVRYLGPNNFLGVPVDGYVLPRVIATQDAVYALRKASQELESHQLSLKIFDAYRPQRAVDHFVRWAGDHSDTMTRSTYYPDIHKSELFEKKYIMSRSSHTRGSTFDLTLVNSRGLELDMGTPWDFFGPQSWPTDTSISKIAQENRALLRKTMLDAGFLPYAEEWWHFTLANEPYPDTYFDFEVK